jgi:uncharacterized protein YeaO (DUF488 family)
MPVKLKRVYDERSEDDGFRILVDRLWPRGLAKAEAGIDLWFEDAAPSNELRRWFGHDPGKWKEFQRRYRAELAENPDAMAALRDAVKSHRKVTLLFGAKDTEHNQAVVLRDLLTR